ncbi:hypothetical protein QML37_31300, partial [Klebsiella pneumoniae]|uniref:hypothetical protein n=1 Tax=Klebsiella pneumoniae TaxID=573 RepID=UPI003A805E2B
VCLCKREVQPAKIQMRRQSPKAGQRNLAKLRISAPSERVKVILMTALVPVKVVGKLMGQHARNMK